MIEENKQKDRNKDRCVNKINFKMMINVEGNKENNGKGINEKFLNISIVGVEIEKFFFELIVKKEMIVINCFKVEKI